MDVCEQLVSRACERVSSDVRCALVSVFASWPWSVLPGLARVMCVRSARSVCASVPALHPFRSALSSSVS